MNRLPEDITESAVSDAERKIEDWLSGSSPERPMAGEQEIEDSLEEVRDQGLERTETRPGTRPGWMQYTWGAGMVRGISYARAGRGRMLALAANNTLQGLYEVRTASIRVGLK